MVLEREKSAHGNPDLAAGVVLWRRHTLTGRVDNLLPLARLLPLFTMNADGSNQENLTKQANSSSPAWAPDGRKIVFSRDDLYVMKSDGTKVKRLTNNPNPGQMLGAVPDWQPLP
jgi:hypothetical protein